MKPYWEDKQGTLYCNDALNVLLGLPDESIDLLATDPPYGISFMGKDWDKALPDKEVWRECYRVLKDGAFAFVLSIPRADCLSRMIINLEDAGFWVNFTPIFWAYASGFPKAENISKMIDRQECMKQLAEKLGRKPTKEEFNEAWKLFREVVSYGQKGRNLTRPKGHIGDMAIDELHQEPISPEITISATPRAKALDGSYGGFQPKPAIEVIIVAMKPLSEKTFVDQALKNRKGISWLDDGRIPYESEDNIKAKNPHTHRENSRLYTEIYGEYQPSSYNLPSGRFPANLLVSDDVLNDGRVTVSSGGKSGHTGAYSGGYKEEYYGDMKPGLGDSGSFSRYFDLDRWFSEKIKELPESVQKTFPFLIVPKASKGEKNKYLDEMKGDIGHNRFDQCAICGGYILQNPNRPSACKCETPIRQHNKVRGNYHPTVKPLKLISYLITLGSREGDLILDPFVGSGTTMLASQLLGRKCIGIEIEEKYCEIAANRCRQSVMEFEY